MKVGVRMGEMMAPVAENMLYLEQLLLDGHIRLVQTQTCGPTQRLKVVSTKKKAWHKMSARRAVKRFAVACKRNVHNRGVRSHDS